MDMAQTVFNTEENLYTSELYFNVIKKMVKRCIWKIAVCGAETWTLRDIYEKYLESVK
jgi:hypothetical protein